MVFFSFLLVGKMDGQINSGDNQNSVKSLAIKNRPTQRGLDAGDFAQAEFMLAPCK